MAIDSHTDPPCHRGRQQSNSDMKTAGYRKAHNHLVSILFALVLGAGAIVPASITAQVLKTEFQDVEPKYIQTASGYSGICVDILEELQKGLNKHDLQIIFPKNFTPPKRIRSNMAAGITDLHCGSARSKAREKMFYFSRQPLYPVNTVVAGRAAEPLEIQSMNDLISSQAVVSSVHETNTHKLLRSQKGLILGPGPRNSMNGLDMLEKERIRFFVYHDLGIFWLIKKTKKESLFRIQPANLRHYAHWMIYSHHLEQSVRQLIENELEKLHNSGVIESIVTRYRPDGPRK